MAAKIIIRDLCSRARLLKQLPIVCGANSAIQLRYCGHIKDWKPGPPPTTKEERENAARKYNLIPEDYEIHPLDEGYGDYPKLPVASQDSRDPYEAYDYQIHRRNYGETLNTDYDIYTSDRWDPNEKFHLSGWKMSGMFFGVIGACVVLHLGSIYFDLRVVPTMKPKQYPGPGKVHYTFEPACD